MTARVLKLHMLAVVVDQGVHSVMICNLPSVRICGDCIYGGNDRRFRQCCDTSLLFVAVMPLSLRLPLCCPYCRYCAPDCQEAASGC